MGGKICCTTDFNEVQPFTYKSEGYRRENIRFHIKESQTSTIKQKTNLPKQKASESKLLDIFQYNLEAPILYLSFSQRKFLGFRNKFEFDRKRVLLASKSSFAVIGYDINDQPHQLMNMVMDEEEEIQLITFIDDENPANILLVTYDFSEECTISRILKLRHEHNLVNDQKMAKREFKAKMNIIDAIDDGIQKGKAIMPKYTIDNFFYSLDE